MPRFEYILSPHPVAAYHWYCQSSSLTEYATFLFFFGFLSMEFIADDLVGASTHFPFVL